MTDITDNTIASVLRGAYSYLSPVIKVCHDETRLNFTYSFPKTSFNLVTSVALFGFNASAPVLWRVRNLLKDPSQEDIPKDGPHLAMELLNDLRSFAEQRLKYLDLKTNPLHFQYLDQLAGVIKFTCLNISGFDIEQLQTSKEKKMAHPFKDSFDVSSLVYNTLDTSLSPILKATKDITEKALLITIVAIATLVDFMIYMIRDVKMNIHLIIDSATHQALWFVNEFKLTRLGDWKIRSERFVLTTLGKMSLLYQNINEIMKDTTDGSIEISYLLDIFSFYDMIVTKPIMIAEVVECK